MTNQKLACNVKKVCPVLSDCEPECNQCGDCCRWIAFPFNGKPDPVTNEWITARGGYFDGGYLVIHSVCPYLVYAGEHGNDSRFACLLHDQGTKPFMCKLYPTPNTWKPKGCSL